MDWIGEFSCFQPILIVPSRTILKFKFRASTYGIVGLVRARNTLRFSVKRLVHWSAMSYIYYIGRVIRDTLLENFFEMFGLTFEVCSDRLSLKRREDRAHASELAE